MKEHDIKNCEEEAARRGASGGILSEMGGPKHRFTPGIRYQYTVFDAPLGGQG